MDKLQPLIRQHFWILLGLVIPLILFGYYSANGGLSSATQARIETLDKTKADVSSGNEPNEDFSSKLDTINTFLEASVDDAILEMWNRQQKRMTWPAVVADRIPKEFLADFEQQVPFIYKGAYEDVFRRLMERVQPVKPLDPMARPNPAAPQQPIPGQKVILMATLPQTIFGQFGASSQEMWDSQIDVWMTELLLDAIVKVNEGKESVAESVVRRLDVLRLMGGTGTPVTADAGGGSGEMMEGGMDPGMGGGGPSGVVKINTSVAFNPAQEFGPAVDGGGGGGGEMMEGSMGGTPAAPPRRYIGEPEGAPFFERGFYMSVIINQNKIPDFIVTLANSDWPVQVRRFQVGANPYRTQMTGPEGMPGGMSEFSMSNIESGPSFTESGAESGSGFSLDGLTPGGRGGARPNPYATNLPDIAMKSLNHPDLVRLDLCGVITMYKQPTEVLAAVEARKQAALEAQKAAAQQPEAAPAEPPAEPAPPADPEAGPATPAPAEGAPATTDAATPAPTPETAPPQ